MPIAPSRALALDAAGWLPAAHRRPSPNCDARPQGMAIKLIVIHNISLPPGVFDGDAVIDLFTNRLDWDAHPYYQGIRGLEVSAHFFIRRDGSLIQFVPCTHSSTKTPKQHCSFYPEKAGNSNPIRLWQGLVNSGTRSDGGQRWIGGTSCVIRGENCGSSLRGPPCVPFLRFRYRMRTGA